MIGFTSRKTAKLRSATPQNSLGVEPVSYGLRADGSLWMKGKKAADKSGNGVGKLMMRNGVFKGFGESDVIGCGLNLRKKEIFFTCNGTYLGVAFKDVELGLDD